MRVVVTGASGNLGTSLLAALRGDPGVDALVGLARRPPAPGAEGAEWVAADVATEDLRPALEGADAVVHLAWQIQPSRDRERLRATNVAGSGRVFEAAARAGVTTLIYASSVGAYSPGPKDREVDEGWPSGGIPTSHYAVDKAEVERRLDGFEREHPQVRVVRLRPALIFKRRAASEIRRYFLGPFVPRFLLAPERVPLVPRLARLRFQAVHADDVAELIRLALHSQSAGAFNVAAGPVLDPSRLAALLGAREVPLPAGLLRAGTSLSWRSRLQPTPPGWLDMALSVPLMSSARAREELAWNPRRSSEEALLELLEGIRDGAGHPTPPLDSKAGGRLRWRELRTGVGGRGY